MMQKQNNTLFQTCAEQRESWKQRLVSNTNKTLSTSVLWHKSKLLIASGWMTFPGVVRQKRCSSLFCNAACSASVTDKPRGWSVPPIIYRVTQLHWQASKAPGMWPASAPQCPLFLLTAEIRFNHPSQKSLSPQLSRISALLARCSSGGPVSGPL